MVGISWYEAAAYCAWLTEHGHRHGWLPPGNEIRLPTSLEWERAARHTDRRRYPWGDAEPTPELANYDQTGIGAPSPVGCFPAGVAECGALDLAGNVFEWTTTLRDQHDTVTSWKDFTPVQVIQLPGGAWYAPLEYLCCGARGGIYPVGRISYRGMRLACSPRSSE